MHFGEKIVLNVKVIKKDLSETEKILYYAEAIHTHYGEKTTSFQDAFQLVKNRRVEQSFLSK